MATLNWDGSPDDELEPIQSFRDTGDENNDDTFGDDLSAGFS